MSSGELDVLIIGGGVTGAGIALDAASRGLTTGIVEAQDWASGTSSRSSKLVHGGLRYLYQLDFALVAEALRERGLLLERTAPHLVKAQPFLWPLKTPVIERAYSAVGVGMYDALAQVAHRGSVPIQKHYSKKGALDLFPDIKEDALCGAIRFYDARVDDARLVVTLVRTAVEYGAKAVSRTQVVELLHEGKRVVGAVLEDLHTGKKYEVRAKHVINATGVWTEKTQSLSGDSGGLKVLASKGIHIVVPKEKINGETGLFLRTEKSVLFIIPWDRYWVIGTTDTKYVEDLRHPVADAEDIDYILDHANDVLANPLTRDDIVGVYAGLRPLLQPKVKEGESAKSTQVSREHTVAEIVPGFTAIAGGKLTTYRVMAEDAVDFALGKERAKELPSVTTTTPLAGAAGYQAMWNNRTHLAKQMGIDLETVEHLLNRYGSEITVLADLIEEDESLRNQIAGAEPYIRAEIVFAARYEGVLHLDDVMMHRTRLNYEVKDRGVKASEEIAGILAAELDWDEERKNKEMDLYRQRCEAQDAAEEISSEAKAVARRLEAPEVTPMHDIEA
ncbi:MAG: glycerol-3-phosphate dehydrogenase/oxidase [Flaviflexus sp.]|nr:glycerol-3-phosphate dehydrogenase/oxidase [Flaviflexus sp.]